MSLRRAAHLVGATWQAARPLSNAVAPQIRSMGGHTHHGNPNDYVTYAGLTLKKAPFGEYVASKAIGALMWFWIFVRTYEDWDHKVYGLPALFEAEGLDDDDDAHHGHH